jgi:ubiquinone/menaquinone biosynthesis C-methylase UbiE
MATTHIDFGYPWWLSYGHALVFVPALALLLIALARKWGKGAIGLFAVLALWSGVSLFMSRFLFDINGVPPLPTANFFREGKGRVLDIGAGTGRSSIMVLAARPLATLVASDLFGQSFEAHFGHGQSPQERLLANLRLAGVDNRATIETADMRHLPFPSASFDAVVSAYAVDHVNREGSAKALAEAWRVVKPGGDFFLILVSNDGWAKFAYGPLLAHGGTRGAAWWAAHLQEAGFQVLEQGTQPVTLYLLARRPL